jgi:hypothetical protein
MKLLVLYCSAAAIAALGGTISDTASGGSPTTCWNPCTTTSGDFTYSAPWPNSMIGNGLDESVEWVFDFSADPKYGAFSGPLSAARLVLTVTPTHNLVSNDVVRILGLADINSPQMQGLPIGVASTVTVNLLNFYTSAEILNELTTQSGRIRMHYEDDSLITLASLELQSDVPEPAAIWLFSAAALMAGIRRSIVQWRKSRRSLG